MKLSDEKLAEVDGRIAVARETLAKFKGNAVEKSLFESFDSILELILVLKQQIISERLDRRTLDANGGEYNKAIDDCLKVLSDFGVACGYTVHQDMRTGEPVQEQYDIIGHIQSLKKTHDANGGWISVKDGLPELGEMVWLYDGHIFIGSRNDVQHEGWLWSKQYDSPEYTNTWDADESEEGDYQVTRWMPLPKLPTQ